MAMYTEEAEDELLGGRPDFVLDAIDNINTKVLGPDLFSHVDGNDHGLIMHRLQVQTRFNTTSGLMKL